LASKWRQNVADYGWSGSEIELIARYVIGGVPSDGFWAVRITGGTWWFVINSIFADPMVLFFNSPFANFAAAQAFGTLEPD